MELSKHHGTLARSQEGPVNRMARHKAVVLLVVSVLALTFFVVCDRHVVEQDPEKADVTEQDCDLGTHESETTFDDSIHITLPEESEINTAAGSEVDGEDLQSALSTHTANLKLACDKSEYETGLARFSDALDCITQIAPVDRDTKKELMMWGYFTEMAVKRVGFEDAPAYVQQKASEFAPSIICPMEHIRSVSSRLDEIYDPADTIDTPPPSLNSDSVFAGRFVPVEPGHTRLDMFFWSEHYANRVLNVYSENAIPGSKVVMCFLAYQLPESACYDNMEVVWLIRGHKRGVQGYLSSDSGVQIKRALDCLNNNDLEGAKGAIDQWQPTTGIGRAHRFYLIALVHAKYDNFQYAKLALRYAYRLLPQIPPPPYFRSLRAWVDRYLSEFYDAGSLRADIADGFSWWIVDYPPYNPSTSHINAGGTEPSAKSASWKARRSKASPSRAIAASRSFIISRFPIK